MITRCLSRAQKRYILYLSITLTLGMVLYCNLCLYLSQANFSALINKKRYYIEINSNTQGYFLCSCFMKLVQLDIKNIHSRNSSEFGNTSRKEEKKIALDNPPLLSSFKNSNAVNKHQISSIKTKAFSRVKKVLSKIKEKGVKPIMVIENKILSKDERFKEISTLNWLSWNKQNFFRLPNKYLMNVSDHSCLPLYPRVVLYNRIFKTASTTMTSFFEKCSKKLNYVVKKEMTEEWSSEIQFHPIIKRIISRTERSERRHENIMAVAHFYFRIDSGIDMSHTYINLLRDPIKRFISHYYYARSPKRWPEKLRRLKALGHWNVTLIQCLEKQYEGCKWNVMTRFFCGPEAFCKTGNGRALSQAKYNMANYYSSIGVLEYLKEFIEVLHKRLPKFVIKPSNHLGKTFVTMGVKKTPLSSDVMARVEQVNHADLELYNYAKTLFSKQAQKCGIPLNL